jgi:hypothetical protein
MERSVGLEDERAVDIIVDTETVDTNEAGRAVAVDIVDTDGAVAVDNETVDTGSDGAVALSLAAGGSDHEVVAMRVIFLALFPFVTVDC